KPFACIPRILKVGAHLVRPIFRMAHRQSRLVIREYAGVFMQIDVSDVGDVVAFTLQETKHIDFVGEELPCASAVIVRTVERDLGRGNPSRAVIGVKRLAAPSVVGLIRINAALKHVSGSARVIAHYENDSGLITTSEAREFGDINTTSPVGR